MEKEITVENASVIDLKSAVYDHMVILKRSQDAINALEVELMKRVVPEEKKE